MVAQVVRTEGRKVEKMSLTESDLLWYIYGQKGKPIPFSAFQEEFPHASVNDIRQKLENLITTLRWVVKKTECLYLVTEDGLKEVLMLNTWRQKGDK